MSQCRGMDYISFGNSIVPSSAIIFLIYLDKSFLDGEPEILCVNFTPGTMFQLQDAEFMLLSKHLNFWRVTYGLRESNQWSHQFFLTSFSQYLYLTVFQSQSKYIPLKNCTLVLTSTFANIQTYFGCGFGFCVFFFVIFWDKSSNFFYFFPLFTNLKIYRQFWILEIPLFQ